MLTKIPGFIQSFYPTRLWKVATEEKVLYLTFDDGPIPEVTPWVLEELKKYAAKATFFCIGDNVRKHPEVFRKVVSEGHSIGNHTYNHLSGWKTSTQDYLENTFRAENVILEQLFSEEIIYEKPEESKNEIVNIDRDISGKPLTRAKRLFRPPYGKITLKQARHLEKKNYKVVMWDVLSRDYDQNLTPEKCYWNVVKNTGPGSIIIFHDSLKAAKNMKTILPKILEYYNTRGFTFKGLEA